VTVTPEIWVDGRPCRALPLPDRGLQFGDGLFETLLLRDGRPLFEALHLERLRRGLAALDFPACGEESAAHIASACAAIAAKGWEWASLRITVTRGGGPRGYAPPADPAPRFIVSAAPLSRDGATMLPAASVAASGIRWSTQPRLAGIKHLNRLDQVLAAAEAAKRGVDEVLMLDQPGRPLSMSAGNLFAVFGDRIVTPPLSDCGIAGTRRRLVMEQWAPAIGLAVEESHLTMAELHRSDEIFFSNSLVALRPVRSLEGRPWPASDVCLALFDRYREAIG
jgi:4-amino-4-deoxychorismate lyase